jgi:hypothetical protein
MSTTTLTDPSSRSAERAPSMRRAHAPASNGPRGLPVGAVLGLILLAQGIVVWIGWAVFRAF